MPACGSTLHEFRLPMRLLPVRAWGKLRRKQSGSPEAVEAETESCYRPVAMESVEETSAEAAVEDN